MFTGIVSDIGEVISVERRSPGLLHRIVIACRYDPATIDIGASIACSGVCMTVIERGGADSRNTFTVEAGAETLALTNVGCWDEGTRVNLERALRIGDELGGHLVSGHVDGLARLLLREDLPDMTRLAFQAPAELARFIAKKGSVALNGVSLTVNGVEGTDFSVLIIPHTLSATTLGELTIDMDVHLEIDQMARYAARLLEAR